MGATMTESTLTEITNAFSRGEEYSSDRVVLPVGFERTLAMLAKHYGDLNDATLWATVLLLVVIEAGGTCLPLEQVAEIRGFHLLPAELQRFRADEWRAALTGSAFGNGTGDAKPLVLAFDRLYFDRFFQLEAAVAKDLLAPLDASDPDAVLQKPENWSAICDEVFTESDGRSRQVAETFWDSRSFVLAGGPGTGKTYTIAKLLVTLHKAGISLDDVSLCAPTGKAALRMQSAINEAMAFSGQSLGVAQQIHAKTIHSLLSLTPMAPRRSSVTALNTKLVICDETSMVDIALLQELLRSLPQSARIILVGDPNQLQSVDVGSAMSDLLQAHERGAIAATVLDVVHRIDDSLEATAREELLEFFAEVRSATSADRAMQLLSDTMTSVTFVPFDEGKPALEQVTPALELAVVRAVKLRELASGARDDVAISEALTSTMVLAAQHEGILSRTWWVNEIASAAHTPSLRADRSGLPLLITTTDRANSLVNGDTGLLIDTDAGVAFVRGGEVGSVPLPASSLRHFQPWWSMTIHKAQGSEFDHVVVAITPGSRLISKELLYTAITRAKRHVIIIATPADLRYAIEHPARRFTGLFEALSAAAKEA
jgi:exodeoxyribonuclease V alpha subunit